MGIGNFGDSKPEEKDACHDWFSGEAGHLF